MTREEKPNCRTQLMGVEGDLKLHDTTRRKVFTTLTFPDLSGG